MSDPTAVSSDPALIEQLGPLLASDPAALADPYPVWNRLREEAPALRLGQLVIFSRYDDAKQLFSMSDSERYGMKWKDSEMVQQLLRELPNEQAQALREVSELVALFMVNSVGEEHARRRRIAHRYFTPRRVAELRVSVQGYLDELLGEMAAGGGGDLMHVAYRLPLLVIVEMLGCPVADADRIHDWSSTIGAAFDPRLDGDTALKAGTAIMEFRAYIRELVATRRPDADSSDLMTTLLEARDGESLTEDELIAMVLVLLFAGHETTTNLISHGLHTLLEHPDQWRAICADPSLVPGAIEELLRYVAPVQSATRFVGEDHEFAGVEVHRGDTVAMSVAAANRDPSVFGDPDRLDILRSDAARHLAFGFGPKFCLGASLTRLEATVVFETLAQRYPDIMIAGDADLRYTGSWVLRSLVSLPVTLGDEATR